MAVHTRLTERLRIEHPILSAPMGFVSGGRLAASVTEAGGLGLLGGGYADPEWLDREVAAAGNARVGVGFITWALAQRPESLELALSHAPAAIMLSFGDPRPFAPLIKQAGRLLICQVQTIAHTREALEAGADIIVAQGTEAGGHGAKRATFTLVPEVADLVARESPATLVVAAGGIADGRGLAAALMLGADGVLVGSRFWASEEALVHPDLQQAALRENGDATVRQIAADIARGFDWPEEFTGRILQNDFTRRWVGNEAEHRKHAPAVRDAYFQAIAGGDAENSGIFVGEAIGIMERVLPAREIVEAMVNQAETLLSHGTSWR
ncbi:MAG: nitronate monooxygenase [Acetobacteraceae bacterium]|nr:nitronate monooxygenase [Acetobacteraceae bacterium]